MSSYSLLLAKKQSTGSWEKKNQHDSADMMPELAMPTQSRPADFPLLDQPQHLDQVVLMDQTSPKLEHYIH
jgi:hypothetical protein